MDPTTSPTARKRGWPWDAIGRATQRYEAAKRRERESRDNGSQGDIDRAIDDANDALADFQRLRERVTDLVVGGLRIALEERPDQVAAKLAELPVIVQLKNDVTELAGAIAAIESRRTGGLS